MLYCKRGLMAASSLSYGLSLTANNSRILGFKAHIPIIELLALAENKVNKIILKIVICLY